MRSNMAYTAPVGSKGVGIIAGEGTYLHVRSVDISGAAHLDEHAVLQRQQ